MKNAETYYAFRIDLMDAEDIDQFDDHDLAPVVHRKDYDELRDLTLELATNVNRILELHDRKDELVKELLACVSGKPGRKP